MYKLPLPSFAAVYLSVLVIERPAPLKFRKLILQPDVQVILKYLVELVQYLVLEALLRHGHTHTSHVGFCYAELSLVAH